MITIYIFLAIIHSSKIVEKIIKVYTAQSFEGPHPIKLSDRSVAGHDYQ